MKRIAALSLLLALTLSLAACGGGNAGTAETPAANSTAPAAETTAPQAEPVEVVVFAAASLEATLTEIADLYKEVAPEVTLTFSFESSGTLRTQIIEGAVCDLFISAGQSQMNDLEAGQNDTGADFVYADTRIDFVENKVVLAVPDNNPKDIQTFSDLATDKLSLLCIGNDDVPVGSYSLELRHHLRHRRLYLRADRGGSGHRRHVQPGHLPRRRHEEWQRRGRRGRRPGLPGLSPHRRERHRRAGGRGLHRPVMADGGRMVSAPTAFCPSIPVGAAISRPPLPPTPRQKKTGPYLYTGR